jgi:hypothetical protein
MCHDGATLTAGHLNHIAYHIVVTEVVAMLIPLVFGFLSQGLVVTPHCPTLQVQPSECMMEMSKTSCFSSSDRLIMESPTFSVVK